MPRPWGRDSLGLPGRLASLLSGPVLSTPVAIPAPQFCSHSCYRRALEAHGSLPRPTAGVPCGVQAPRLCAAHGSVSKARVGCLPAQLPAGCTASPGAQPCACSGDRGAWGAPAHPSPFEGLYCSPSFLLDAAFFSHQTALSVPVSGPARRKAEAWSNPDRGAWCSRQMTESRGTLGW